MQKVISITPQKKGINPSHRKENWGLYRGYKALGVKDGEISEIADLRIYFKGNTAYACLWVFARGQKGTYGSGKAGGFGYCKASQAAWSAFVKAGIETAEPFGGHGLSSVREAMLALGTALRDAGETPQVIEMYA